MLNLGLLGYSGRMGQAIAKDIADRSDCKLSAGLVRTVPAVKPTDILITDSAHAVVDACDIVIDFTLANLSPAFAKLAASKGKAFMCGTTGLDAAGLDALKLASQQIPVLYAPNTSLSLAAMKQITTLAARLLGGLDYDVAILDEHHRMKKDSPSGTAIALGEAVLKGNSGKKEPSYATIRAGHIVGEHEVSFVGQGEIIRLRHSVTDRKIFARGAVQAALWLNDKPAGLYGMEDVLGLN